MTVARGAEGPLVYTVWYHADLRAISIRVQLHYAMRATRPPLIFPRALNPPHHVTLLLFFFHAVLFLQPLSLFVVFFEVAAF